MWIRCSLILFRRIGLAWGIFLICTKQDWTSGVPADIEISMTIMPGFVADCFGLGY